MTVGKQRPSVLRPGSSWRQYVEMVGDLCLLAQRTAPTFRSNWAARPDTSYPRWVGRLACSAASGY